MKKKLVTALLFIILSANVVACGSKEATTNEPVKITEVESSILTNEKESESIIESDTEKESESIGVSEKTLEDIENYLLNKGLLSGERVRMGAELIGGIDGFKYKDSVGEIYEYDVNSEEYKKLANGDEIPLQGMEGFTIKAASVNGKFVLIGDDASQEMIDAFNSFE